jgi:hypothetical protein
MGKRLGRRRLFALNKVGESMARTAGPGMVSLLGNQSRLRSGQEIITEITIDLAANGGGANVAAHSFNQASTATEGTAPAVAVLGVSSSSGTHLNANVITVDNSTVAGTAGGVVTSGELVCVEAPTGGENGIGLWYGSALSGAGADLTNGGVQLIAVADQVVGKDGTFDVDVDLDDKNIYLVSSGSTAADYTAGKFVLRLYGFNIFADVV